VSLPLTLFNLANAKKGNLRAVKIDPTEQKQNRKRKRDKENNNEEQKAVEGQVVQEVEEEVGDVSELRGPRLDFILELTSPRSGSPNLAAPSKLIAVYHCCSSHKLHFQNRLHECISGGFNGQ
jgi:hypothetical protein